MKDKKKVYVVDTKPRWTFMGKFYIICIILFVAFVSYIVIYREIHKDEIIERIKSQQSNNTVIQNTVME